MTSLLGPDVAADGSAFLIEFIPGSPGAGELCYDHFQGFANDTFILL
jgi:hypothetical protein